MPYYVDSRMQPVESGLYTFIDSPRSVIIISVNQGRYSLTSTNGFNPHLNETVARRLRPLSPIELKSLTLDRRESTTLNILSRKNPKLAEVIRHSLEAVN